MRFAAIHINTESTLRSYNSVPCRRPSQKLFSHLRAFLRRTFPSLFPSYLLYPPSPMAPGMDYSSAPVTILEVPAPSTTCDSVTISLKEQSPSSNVYYNPRLDPQNYLDGPLSWNPATRLRQMLARPGIIVSLITRTLFWTHILPIPRLLRVFVTVSAPDAP
jgi:hypothetical protein